MPSAVVAYKFEPPLLSEERTKLLAENRSQRDAERGVREMVRATSRFDEQRRLIALAIAENHIARYPVATEDERDENGQPPVRLITLDWLEAQIVRAFENAGMPATVDPYYVARRIAARYDEELGTGLCALPRKKADQNRIVGHLEQLGLGLPPRIMGTLARRLFLALANRGTNHVNGVADTEFCVECGQQFARGDKCGCSS